MRGLAGMYKQYTRALSAREERLLASRSMGRLKAELLKGLVGWSTIWLSLGAALFVVYRMVWHSWMPLAAMVVLGLFALINLDTFFRWRGYARDTEQWRATVYGKILEEHAVQITEVTSSRVAMLAEQEDEGALWVFDVGDGRLFWLSGQGVGPTLGKRAWPNEHFEIIRSLDGTVELGINGLGRKIQSITALAPEEFASLNLPKDELVAGTMDTIREVFT